MLICQGFFCFFFKIYNKSIYFSYLAEYCSTVKLQKCLLDDISMGVSRLRLNFVVFWVNLSFKV